jgi:hypothetical protein
MKTTQIHRVPLRKLSIVLAAAAILASCQIGSEISVKSLPDGNTIFVINRDDGEKSCAEGVQVTELDNKVIWELTQNKLPLVKGKEICQNYFVYGQPVYNFTSDVTPQKLQVGTRYRVAIAGHLFSDETVFVAGQ